MRPVQEEVEASLDWHEDPLPRPQVAIPREKSLENGHPLVNLCRGVVLRSLEGTTLGEAGQYEIIGRPFDRFYNLGSSHAAPIDWDSAAFEEKLDGTLCIVYFDSDFENNPGGGWCVATRNVPDGDIPNHQGDTFAALFWRHVDPEYRWMIRTQEGSTYMFELMGPENQIVVVYDEWKVTLLAYRDNETGQITRGSAPVHRFRDGGVAPEEPSLWSRLDLDGVPEVRHSFYREDGTQKKTGE